jgi:hypothetical protein
LTEDERLDRLKAIAVMESMHGRAITHCHHCADTTVRVYIATNTAGDLPTWYCAACIIGRSVERYIDFHSWNWATHLDPE